MGRYTRNTAILAKLESTYGTDATPSEATNALLVSNAQITPLAAQNVKRDLIRPYLGGSEELLGASYIELSFEVELAGSGAAGTAPAYGPLLKACGFSETVSAGVRTEYNLLTPVVDSVSVYYFSDGVKHVAKGCRGDVTFKLNSGGRPAMAFKLQGLDGGLSAATPAALALSGFKTPLVVTEANTGDVTFGCTYTAATPTLTGGLGYPSQGLEVSLGNSVSHTPLLGGETVEITNREANGKVQLDLTAAQEVSFMASVRSNAVQAIGLMHGTVPGGKVMLFMPAVQLVNPSKQDVNGKLMIGFDMRVVPASGNDEIKLVVH
ncbi:hypothetical protein GBK02_09160 [Dechloromonas sp. TW-R-39-2]|uniref:phage tail tube protein n=1 Tax=Dechloromonas sp. TW-R-39-2 TaxID=2654218 RepID=UPI00193C896C|nr:phage tail tube protein [Dechloromonas sp. TW-R-39-2]QRM19558.1 hypothetical protein GBK02_09160 [Dechloromonas sp. TW-R-39-2]